MHSTRDFAFEIKSINNDGTFSGYGSVFGVVDSYNEVVAPGAFKDSLAAHKIAGTMPALLWQHRADEPIGVYSSMAEDERGLVVAGRLALKTQRGSEAYELMKLGAINGLSIGFQTIKDAVDRKTGIRTLEQIKLWETSLVTFPANEAARVETVKSLEEVSNWREFEQRLRDSGCSRSLAVTAVATAKRLGQGDPGEGIAQLEHALRIANLRRRLTA